MVGRREGHGKAAQRLAAQALQTGNQRLAAELAAGALEALDEQFGSHIPFHAGEVCLGILAGRLDGIGKLARDRARRVVGRRHDLGHHHTGTVLAQLVGQRLRADKRHVVERAAVTGLARSANEGGTGFVGADLHHGIRGRGDQGLDRLGHIDGIALHRGLRHRFEPQAVQGQRHAVQAGLAVGVVLVEHRDFLQSQAGQLLDDEAGLVVVRSADVKGVFVERLAQAHGAGERGNKRHLVLGRQRQGRQAGRGTDVAKQRKHVIGNQLAGVLGAAVRLVTIVQVADFNLALAHAALGVDLVKTDLGPLVKLDAQLRGRTGKGGRLAKDDLAVGLGPGNVETGQHGGAGGE